MREEKKDIRVGRRGFLARFGFGTAAVAATVVAGPFSSQPQTPVQPSLRPKCKACATIMVIRNDCNIAAHCPNILCAQYWKPVGIILQDEVDDRINKKWWQRKKEELEEKYAKLVKNAKNQTKA